MERCCPPQKPSEDNSETHNFLKLKQDESWGNDRVIIKGSKSSNILLTIKESLSESTDKICRYNLCSSKVTAPNQSYMMGSNYISAFLQRSLMYLSIWTILSKVNVAKSQAQFRSFASRAIKSVSCSPFDREAGLKLKH